MKRFLALLMAVLLLISAGSAMAEVLKCPNCGAEFNPELGYIYCPFCATPLSKEHGGSASDFAVGDVITFGSYEQDNNLDNGPEPIEWIVLDVQDGKALLLSKYGLTAKAYNEEEGDITWEERTLREWLNHEFINRSFDEKERDMILITFVDNSETQQMTDIRGTGGNDTEDKVFLLSYLEAFYRYFLDGTDRRCLPTDCALQEGAWISYDAKIEGRNVGAWWLRSPSIWQHDAMLVGEFGDPSYNFVEYNDFLVRPALWMNLE